MRNNWYLHVFLWPLSGLMLAACWPPMWFTALVFVAFVPLFILENNIEKTHHFFWICLGNMLLWNTLTTWWIVNSTWAGAAGAIITNSALMCLPWLLYRWLKNQLGLYWGLAGLVAFWISFEYIHHYWDLSWPWLTLGNVFAQKTNWIQWYEITGTTGGSLWVLVVNALLAASLLTNQTKRIAAPILVLVIPLAISWQWTYEESAIGHYDALIVQPNVEAYTEKFETPPDRLVADLLDLTTQAVNENTRLVIWPETAIPAQVWENKIEEATVLKPLRNFVDSTMHLGLLTGMDSYWYWGQQNPGTMSIRKTAQGDFYEAFNTALFVDPGTKYQLYHKRKLVPGVETLPSWLRFIGFLFDDFGGISGSLGKSDQAVVFKAENQPFIAAPIICYESIYSNYVTEYVRKGANVLTVITNDGWWGNTPGHIQHMNLARLRAIENRRWVLRSANTGISCIINSTGEIVDQLGWAKKGILKHPIPVLNRLTFYSKHGDWMSSIVNVFSALFLSALLLKSLFSQFVKKRT